MAVHYYAFIAELSILDGCNGPSYASVREESWKILHVIVDTISMVWYEGDVNAGGLKMLFCIASEVLSEWRHVITFKILVRYVKEIKYFSNTAE